MTSYSIECVNVDQKMLQWTRIALLVLMTGVHNCFSDVMLAPKFDEHPESGIIKHLGKAVLHCHVTPESAEIHWKFNKQPLQRDPISGIEINGGRLQITSFRHVSKDHRMSHEGLYQCVANNSVGVIVSREARLQRAFMDQFEAGSDKELTATEGNTALIPCTPPKGVPPPVTVFEFNGKTIDPSSKRHVVLPSGNMQISSVKQSDQGDYKCISINPVSNQQHVSPYTIQLHIKTPTTNSPPQFIQEPAENHEVIEGDDLTLECVFQGSPVPVVVWDKHNGQLPKGRYTQVLGNLVIRDVEIDDQGTYVCRAENTNVPGKAAAVNVDIIEPPRIEIPPSDQIAIDGATVAFQCVTAGRSVHTEWLYNGDILYSSGPISVTETSLTITRVGKSNQGIYQCVARSRLGMTTAAALLQVKGQGEVNYTWPELPKFPEYNNNKDADVILIDPTFKPNMSIPPFGQPDDPSGGRGRKKNNRKNQNRGDDMNFDQGGGFDGESKLLTRCRDDIVMGLVPLF